MFDDNKDLIEEILNEENIRYMNDLTVILKLNTMKSEVEKPRLEPSPRGKNVNHIYSDGTIFLSRCNIW